MERDTPFGADAAKGIAYALAISPVLVRVRHSTTGWVRYGDGVTLAFVCEFRRSRVEDLSFVRDTPEHAHITHEEDRLEALRYDLNDLAAQGKTHDGIVTRGL